MTDTNDSSLTSASTAPSDPPSSAPSPTTAGATPPPAAAFAQARATRPQIVGSEGPERPYPIYLRGEVERGFGRGGKELGCATANLPTRVLAPPSKLTRTGIYFGWARVLPQDPDDPDIAQPGEEHLAHEAGAREDDGSRDMPAPNADEEEEDEVVLGASPPSTAHGAGQSAEQLQAEFLERELASGPSGKPRQLSQRSTRSVGTVMDKAATLSDQGSASESGAAEGTATQAQGTGSAPRDVATGDKHGRDLSTASSTGSLRRRRKKPRVALAEQDSHVFPMVMSVGWNPFYQNTKKTAEVHIMHKFAADFYGLEVRVVVLGYIRPEYNYVSREALIEDIEMDKQVALNSLQRPLWQDYGRDPFLGVAL